MIKAGIIGFGYMGHFHMNKARQSGEVQITAVCDVKEEALREAAELGIRAYPTEAADRFLAEDMDLVIIATQNQFHKDYSVRALKAGHHVMCEKPVTMNVRELEEIIRVSRETKKIFTVHQQRRFDRDYLMVRNIVESGAIGRIHTIESRIFGERGVCFGWRADPESGGGMLYDWAPHLIDQYLQMFSGETVTSVQARLCSILTPAVDDYVEVSLAFSGGTTARIVISTFELQKMPRWFVMGDRGTMKLDDMTGISGGVARIRREVRGFDSVLHKPGLGPSRTMAPLEPEFLELLPIPEIGDTTMYYWDNLTSALKGECEVHVKPDEVLRQMKILETARESARVDQIIKVSI